MSVPPFLCKAVAHPGDPVPWCNEEADYFVVLDTGGKHAYCRHHKELGERRETERVVLAWGIEKPPVKDPGCRKMYVNRDLCPECGDCLDTGWECNGCGFDAMPEAYSDIDIAWEQARKKKRQAT